MYLLIASFILYTRLYRRRADAVDRRTAVEGKVKGKKRSEAESYPRRIKLRAKLGQWQRKDQRFKKH